MAEGLEKRTQGAGGFLRRLLDAPGRPIVAAAALVALALIGWFVHAQQSQHAEATARAGRDAHNVAHLLAEHAARSFEAIDETLRAVDRLRADVARGIYRSQASIHVHLRTLHGGSPLLEEIGWFDSHGDRIATSRMMDPPRISMARHESFRIHATSAGTQIHVARPVRANGEAGWLIEFSRRMENLDGSFAGIAHGTLDVRRFVEVYAGLVLAPGHEITLLRGDGVLLARWPHGPMPVFQPADQGMLHRAVRGGVAAESYQEISPLRRAAVIGSYAVVPRSGGQLVVDVNVLRDAALAPFWAELAKDGVVLGVSLVLLTVGTSLLVVVLSRREALRVELAAANATARAAAEAAARIARSEAELQRALEAEREMSAEQRRFVAIASHEFRTPLAVIDGAAQRIARKLDDPSDLAKFVDRVREGVRRMIDTIDRTLTLARADSTPVAFAPRAVDVARLVDGICARHRTLNPDFTIETRLPAAPTTYVADPVLLGRAIDHLLSNAVSYSGGGRRIVVSMEPGPDQVVLSVRDHGIGIPADEVPRLFTRYRRASTSGNAAGLGMGLCDVREIARLHEGTAELHSVVGEGTVVTLRLRLREAPVEHDAAA